MTYAELIASLQVWVESSETAQVAELDFIIELAEKRIYRSIDFNEALSSDATLVITQGLRTISLPEEVIVLQTVYLLDSGGTTFTPLLQKDRSFLRDFMPDESIEGTPRYYAYSNDTLLLIAPTPDAAAAAGTISVTYTIYPTQLSGTETTTWLSSNAPDVLLYACLKELAAFMKEEPDIIANYDKMYQEAFQGLLLQENFRNRTDTFRDGEIKVNL